MALIHNWPLDEASGAIMADAAGDSDGQVINNTPNTIVAGKFGNARNGTDTSIAIPRFELWQGSVVGSAISQYSLSFWMRSPSATLADWPYAWDWGNYSSPSFTSPVISSFFDKDFQNFTAEFFDNFSGSSTSVLLEHAANFSDDQWHLIVIRCDGAKTELLVDGAQVDTVARAVGLNLKGVVGDAFFGGNDSGQYAGFSFDDLAIFDHYISDSEVEFLWNSGAGRAVIGLNPQPIDGYISMPGSLQSPTLLGISDWTQAVQTTDQIYYAAEIYGSPYFNQLRLPISSWQATLQQDRSSYLQCVVPAADQYIEGISSIIASTVKWLSIKRGVVKSDGSVLELEIARVRIQEMSHNRGPQRSTVTLSGYDLIAFNTYAIDSSNPGAFRTLPEVQTISAQNGTRVRCGIDWLLRPGMVAVVDGASFVVSYINFYVNATQEFMDVGEREL